MKKLIWKLAGIAAVAGMSSSAFAQDGPGPLANSAPVVTAPSGPGCVAPSPAHPSTVPAPSPTQPSSTTSPATPSSTTPSATTDPSAAQTAPTSPSGQTSSQDNGVANLNSIVSGGLGSAGANSVAMTAGPVTTVTTVSTTQSPLILPGQFTSATVEFVRPIDRVYFTYGYFDGFKVNSTTGPQSGFNLNVCTVGVEKTLFDGLASIYVRAPFLWATQNVTNQGIDGIGDVNVGLKVALLNDADTGNTVSVGLTVSVPTGRDAVVTTTNTVTQTITDSSPPPSTTTTTSSASTVTKFNPTYLQPWIGGLLVWEGLFVQEYFGVVVPSDDRIATFINNDVTLGYQIYKADEQQLLSSLTPFVSAQVLIPVNHHGAGATTTVSASSVAANPVATAPALSSLGFPDQLWVTGGVAIGVGERAVLSCGVVTPVVGPKGYNVGGTVGLNFAF